MGACFRVIPSAIPDFQWAGFPEDLAQQLSHYRNGLVLICGVVGSGKTTSLAMLINLLNQEGGYRIITVEEPVEYLFPKTPGVGGHAAGGRPGRPHLRRRPEVRPAAGPGRDPGRRNPRPGDRPDGPECGRDGPPRASPPCTPATPKGRSPAMPISFRKATSRRSARSLP